MKQRTIKKITQNAFHRGFLGQGHEASAVVDGSNFAESDPFIILMDDRLDLPGGQPVGGPHPHAGFETVTFVLQGNGREWKTGSLELMTAGKGIIHTEEITTRTSMRILQLWLALPPEKRWVEPRWQEILLEDVPTLKTSNSEIRVYSGGSNGLTSPLQNYTPFTLVDFHLKAQAEVVQQLPAAYHGFIYVIEGSVWVGDKEITKDQAGWFGTFDEAGDSDIVFKTQSSGARFVLYAGLPHGMPIVSHGPFIGDTEDDIRRLYKEFREGKIIHLNDLPESKKVRYRLAVG